MFARAFFHAYWTREYIKRGINVGTLRQPLEMDKRTSHFLLWPETSVLPSTIQKPGRRWIYQPSEKSSAPKIFYKSRFIFIKDVLDSLDKLTNGTELCRLFAGTSGEVGDDGRSHEPWRCYWRLPIHCWLMAINPKRLRTSLSAMSEPHVCHFHRGWHGRSNGEKIPSRPQDFGHRLWLRSVRPGGQTLNNRIVNY